MIQIPLESKITEYLHRKASHAGIPLSGTFELTPVCNMNCKMCYVRMSRQQQEAIRPLRSAKEWLALAEKARDAGMVFLLLTGGEPFLHPEFREILTGLHKMGFIISINSNGTLIDEDTVQWLRTVPPTRINITLYGASNETYERLCGNPKGYTQATNAIRLLKNAGITVKLNCSVTPHNAADVSEIVEFARREGLVVQTATYMFPPLRREPAMIGQNDRFSPKEAAYYSAFMEYLLNGEEAFLNRPDDKPLSLAVDNDENCGELGEKIRCRAGKCSFWITWKGDMLPCGMFPGTTERNVFEDDFLSVWEQVKRMSDCIRLPAKCAGCSLKDTCKACAAMAVTETGCFDKVPQYRCMMTLAYAGERQRLKNEILAGHNHADSK